MAASRTLSPEPASQEVFSWLKNLPLAPEYHPTVAEFQDPIAYIFKIEKEASSYGICKIVPPVPPAPKKSVISNFNRSLAARSTESTPTFTTRQQQVGFCPRKPCPVKKPVWQSGESYTFQDFETKARAFEKNYLKKCSKKSSNPSALEIETLYWKATVDKPISVEYANDMPGSAFIPLNSRKTGEGQGNVGDSNWNMRGVSRWLGSLLKFMKEEIPGVTSPMVYVAMLFSWFAWHVEDHDLHSLNYMHLGAGKTWYGVPRDAAVAFEEVARVHGYGGEVNPLVTFAILGEKTTVISPEVLVGAGVPCCRLVQNAGEFVVTFPRAYHSGFSHGFNCGEAANIATPEWLKFAKEAAIRRASINYPPMVSHFQLLYDLALALCSRVPTTINPMPRSSRLKDKKKSEGESMIKEEFVHDVIQNNNLLHTLCKGATSFVVLLPHNSSDISSSRQNLHVGANSRLALGLCDPTDEDIKSPERVNNPLKGGSTYSMKAKFSSLCDRRRVSSYYGNGVEDSQEHGEEDKTNAHLGDMLSDQRLFSCVTCGILTFSCAAILQPKAPATRYLGSAECSLLNDWTAHSIERFDEKGLDSGLRHSGDCKIESPDRRDHISSVQEDKGSSALGLIGLNYGNSSDSEQDVETEHVENEASICDDLDSSARFETKTTRYGSVGALKPKDTSYVPPIYNEESSRPHVFCLEHAIEAETQLRPVGGAEIFLICHPDYPKIEAEAKSIAEEIGDDYAWNALAFRNASKEDKERIKAALDSDDATLNSADWTVKLGVNLFYSVRLSWSPLYSKQMPYNPVIHKAFGRRTISGDDDYGKRSRKKVVEGKWCGKVWMSNQIHPILAHDYNREEEEEEEAVQEEDERKRSGYTSSVAKKKKRKVAAKPSRPSKKRRTSLCKEEEVMEEEEAVSDEEDVVKSIENHTDSDDNSLEENYCRQQPRGRIYGGSNSNSNSKAAEFTPVEDVMNSDVSQSGDSDPPPRRREFSDEESAPPPKIYSRRKKQQQPTVVVSNDNCSRRPWSLRNKKPKQDLTSSREMVSTSLNPGLTKGRISLPVRQRTPRIASKNVAALRLGRQVSGFVEEEKEEEQEQEQEHEQEQERRGPSTRLRMKKSAGPTKGSGPGKQQVGPKKKAMKTVTPTVSSKKKASTGCLKPKADEGGEHGCDIEGCGMSFRLKQELTLHMKNICPVKGCGKKFFSHKYLVQHRRVHDDDRPLKCPWKGCKMTFKWAWARTEHIRVHTGVRPYVCGEPGCGQTFRFVSDFSRHKRKTGHSIKGKG